ncbi:MAG TPA: DUF305 domain-containing protein [candidate division Zixibacteria bacterium]|nr:DUF305 domain-containing protein [candidate division Zixibacteria bacterium]
MTDSKTATLAQAGPAGRHPGTGPSGRPAGSSPYRRELEEAMDNMMKEMHAAGYTGNPDVDFLAMMIPHHQGAVAMARAVLIHGEDPLTRRLAEEIIASQTAEIAAMTRRLEILRRGADPDPGGFPAIHGTRGTDPHR